MLKKSRQGNGLSNLVNTGIFIDTNQYSKDYFQLLDFPSRLYVGKNSFRIVGNNQTLVIGSRVFIDILDSNGNIIYHEVLDVSTSDFSKIVVAHVYPDTPSGEVTVYIAGRLVRDPNSGIRIPYSNDEYSPHYKNIPNILWIGKTVVVNNKQNSNDIFFIKEPKVFFQEKLVTYSPLETGNQRSKIETGSDSAALSMTSRTPPSQFSDRTVFSTGFVDNSAWVRKLPKISNNTGESRESKQIPKYAGLSTITCNESLFNRSMEGGMIYIDVDLTSIYQDQFEDEKVLNPEYTASIVKVVNSSTIQVDTPFDTILEKYTVGGIVQTDIGVNSFTDQDDFSIHYYDNEVSRSLTLTEESFLSLEFIDLEPQTGVVDKINVSYKAVGSIGELTSLGDYSVNESNLLIDNNNYELTLDSGIQEFRIGFPYSTEEASNYWDKEGVGIDDNDITITKEDDRVLSAFRISHTGLTNKDMYIKIFPTDDYSVTSAANTEYILKFLSNYESDPAGSNRWSPPFIDVYVSGSPVTTDIIEGKYFDSPIRNSSLGTYIGSVNSRMGKIRENEFSFLVKERKDIKPIFVIRSGEWDIGQVELKPRKSIGFSPNQTKINVPLTYVQRDSELIFEFKYLNNMGVSANVDTRVYGLYFSGSDLIYAESSGSASGSCEWCDYFKIESGQAYVYVE